MSGRIWTQADRFGNQIYLTQERWDHITDPSNLVSVTPMNEVNYNYDRDADVLYISFAKSNDVFAVELSDHLVLRLDLGNERGTEPRAIGITVLFPAELVKIGHNPLTLQLDRLRRLPIEAKSAVLEVLSKPPVSTVLATKLEFTAAAPSLPELPAA